ncbi:MAG TPA: hypothetical protein VGP33_00955, partial [Chloroflexota bacterium]|nr:hypothetical protein [Chloroflexota bacterium]
YALAGVREYLTLDPAYRYAPEGGLGWQLVEGVYRPWRREANRRWQSQGLPLAFGLEGTRAAVYASDGHRFLREGEVERALREQQGGLQERDRRLAEQERRLAWETQERQRAEAEAEQERQRRVAMERQEQALTEEVDRLRRRLEELERGL